MINHEYSQLSYPTTSTMLEESRIIAYKPEIANETTFNIDSFSYEDEKEDGEVEHIYVPRSPKYLKNPFFEWNL